MKLRGFSRFFIFLIIVLRVSSSYAKDIQLTCGGEDEWHVRIPDLYSITLNEEKEKYYFYAKSSREPLLSSYSGKAVFFPTHIYFEVYQSNSIRYLLKIDRKNLTYTRTLEIYVVPNQFVRSGWGYPSIMTGTCTITKKQNMGNKI